MRPFGHFIRVVFFLLMLYLIHKEDKRKSAIEINIWTFIVTGLFIIILGTYYVDAQDIYNLSMSFGANLIVGLFDASLFVNYILIAILIYSYIRWITQKKKQANPDSPTYDPEYPVKFSQYLKQHFFSYGK